MPCGTIAPGRPVAVAGAPRTVATGEPLALSAAGSLYASRFRWEIAHRPVGGIATLAGADGVATTFTAETVGSYLVTLVAGDGAAESPPAVVPIFVTQAVVPKSFAQDVLPIFSRAGCLGCHGGNGTAVGVLRLDGTPEAVYAAVNVSPRVKTDQPAESLILTKPAALVPHGGGPNPFPGFALGGDHADYDTILTWIREGASAN